MHADTGLSRDNRLSRISDRNDLGSDRIDVSESSGLLAQSRIAMAQQVGGAVALDAPASSVSYWTHILKKKSFLQKKN